ncbi:PfkB family carbohydrate kinase, partial [Salmonella enterica subsp. enterica serovar Anatum]|nr:PfkB family carbohydrate kinase [Salmonella enterica subsp. enterica serovar Anatum]
MPEEARVQCKGFLFDLDGTLVDSLPAVAVAAGRSGANIAFIACTGDDDIGDSIRKQLVSDRIDIAPVSV